MAAVERDPQSNSQSPLEQKAAEAKAFVRDEAKNPTNEQDFKQKMQKALNDAKNKVQVLQKEVRRAANSEPAKKRKEEKQADLFANLVQFLEALKVGVTHSDKDYRLTFKELGILDEKAGNLILKIYEKLPASIAPNSVVPLTKFIFEIAKKRPKKTDIKREWDTLKKEIETDIPLLRGLRDSLIEAVRTSDIEGFANEEEARVDFNVPNDNIIPFQAGLSKEEQAEIARIENSIQGYIRAMGPSGAEIQRMLPNLIQSQDADYLFSLMPGAFNNNIEEAELYMQLKSRAGRGGIQLLKNLALNFGLSAQSVETLSSEFIFKNLSHALERTSHGEIEFSSELKEQMQNTVFRIVTAVMARATNNPNEHFDLDEQERRTITYLQTAINRLKGDPIIRRRFNEQDPTGALYDNFVKFISELNIFIDEEKTRRANAHNLVNRLVLGAVSLATMKDDAAKMNISNVNSILAGYQGYIIDMATHLIPQHIQHRTANKNQN